MLIVSDADAYDLPSFPKPHRGCGFDSGSLGIGIAIFISEDVCGNVSKIDNATQCNVISGKRAKFHQAPQSHK